MIRFLTLFMLLLNLYGDEYSFKGKHFVASYLDCNLNALCNLHDLIDTMNRAVQASGATVLDQTHYIFPPHGLTIVYLISESHASLHTYPEHGACFVDLFTCGETHSLEAFDQTLRDYLQPKNVNAKLLSRSQETEEIHSCESY